MALIEVSKEQFFNAVGGPEDIHPRSEAECSVWVNQRTRAEVGRSEPGYKSPYGTPRRYWLEEQFAARKAVKPA